MDTLKFFLSFVFLYGSSQDTTAASKIQFSINNSEFLELLHDCCGRWLNEILDDGCQSLSSVV